MSGTESSVHEKVMEVVPDVSGLDYCSACRDHVEIGSYRMVGQRLRTFHNIHTEAIIMAFASRFKKIPICVQIHMEIGSENGYTHCIGSLVDLPIYRFSPL